jgi:hypothetical protein
MKKAVLDDKIESQLYFDVCSLIENERYRLAVTANTEICLMNWQIGKRIKDDVLYSRRAEYGKQIVKNLAIRLTERYGKGWGYEKLKHCIRSAYSFSEDEIRYAVSTQLPDKKLLSEKLQRAIAIAREYYADYKMNKIDNE